MFKRNRVFERYIHFLVVELPSTLAYHVIENFHTPSMELRLQKGSIKATRQKFHDILSIPMGKMKLEDLEQRPYNNPFIAEWEAQYSHLGKPTPRAISLQISSTHEADFMFNMNFITLFGNEYSDSDGDSDNDSKNNDEEGSPMTDENLIGNEQNENVNEKESYNEKEKETRDDLGKGKGEGECEPKEGGEEVQADVNNETEFEKVIGEDNEDAVLMEVDNQKEGEFEKVSEKVRNENEGNDNMNKNEMKNDTLQKEQ
ncbi:hypothetical protein Tco_1132114 [Tanacetum coccineum]|uniref:Uncharacterized protein n=1 Tax=Tanacetum coccineum TaxID=301880 RepID=A0ABQ5JDZ5_9ASTR